MSRNENTSDHLDNPVGNYAECVSSLRYLHGKPTFTAAFRSSPDDFQVDEIMPVAFDGEGEHVCLHVEKRNLNTMQVVKMLARHLGVKNHDVGYSGLKDRHAVTTQWFSVPVPIKQDADFSPLVSDELKILEQCRHSRKIRLSSHKVNRFTITLRADNMPDFSNRLAVIKEQGVPNYFGEQRFGFDGHNLAMAVRMFGGEKIRDRKLKGLVISAARSQVFNQVVSQRIAEGLFEQPLQGDAFMLAGSKSFFTDDGSDDIQERLIQNDILLSAPMPGSGNSLVSGDALVKEQAWTEHYQAWQAGLEKQQVKQERRAIKLLPQELTWQHSENALTLSFLLPSGCFATAVLRELVNLEDVSQQRKPMSHEDSTK